MRSFRPQALQSRRALVASDRPDGAGRGQRAWRETDARKRASSGRLVPRIVRSAASRRPNRQKYELPDEIRCPFEVSCSKLDLPRGFFAATPLLACFPPPLPLPRSAQRAPRRARAPPRTPSPTRSRRARGRLARRSRSASRVRSARLALVPVSSVALFCLPVPSSRRISAPRVLHRVFFAPALFLLAIRPPGDRREPVAEAFGAFAMASSRPVAAAPVPPPFPVPTLAWLSDAGGVSTRFSLSVYSSRVVAAATQTGAVGAALEARADEAPGGGVVFEVREAFGPREDALGQIAARQACEKLLEVGTPFDAPLLLLLGLGPEARKNAPKGRETVREIVKELQEGARKLVGKNAMRDESANPGDE